MSVGLRGDVERGDYVKVQPTMGQHPIEGQVVTRTDDGRVTVAIYNGIDEVTVDESKVWLDGYLLREVDDAFSP